MKQLIQGNVVQVESRGEEGFLLVSHNDTLWRCQGKFAINSYSSWRDLSPQTGFNSLLGGRVLDTVGNTLVVLNGDTTTEIANIEKTWQLVDPKNDSAWLNWVNDVWDR